MHSHDTSVAHTVQSHTKDHVEHTKSKAQPAVEFAKQALRLGHHHNDNEDDASAASPAAEAIFVTAQDPVIETISGGRLPAVPLEEAQKLNELKDKLEDRDPREQPVNARARHAKDGTMHGVGLHGVLEESAGAKEGSKHSQSTAPDAPLKDAVAPSKTNPLFPPLPVYGPPTFVRTLHCWIFRISSSALSLCFLATVVLGAIFTYAPLMLHYLGYYIRLQHPDTARQFHIEEQNRAKARQNAADEWNKYAKSKQSRATASSSMRPDEESRIRGDAPSKRTQETREHFVPTEGGADRLVCDVGYYARREGLDSETFLVQTEDGFIIELWHIYNPLTYTPGNDDVRQPHSPNLFPPSVGENIHSQGHGYAQQYPAGSKKYPVLLLHGLLQSSGAYCCTGPNSLAFYLAKAGYDVWLGNNRCGFQPKHTMLKYSDPRMWAWNIRQMGVLDLPALVSRVLTETGFEKCALIAHSQGTTQTLVALAKEQRPELGRRLSVVCLLAPAAYAGPLIGKAYFKFMRVISPAMFRLVFGIHAFIPFMLTMHKTLPGGLYGFMGYRVFSFLFNWTDDRWDRGLRNRCFIFAPVYVSSESMRWWLGRECFAQQKCILATMDETRMEDEEDKEDGAQLEAEANNPDIAREHHDEKDGANQQDGDANGQHAAQQTDDAREGPASDRGRFAWYDENAPPMAFWVAGSDDLVDGRRFLRRFERGREPHVNVVHTKIIEDYEHLDVIWAVNSLEQVGKEVGEVIWKTASDEAKSVCRTPHLELDA